jgi:ABC-2 type transport system ATP-binding protein
MSIQVSNITKLYGPQKALDNVSFSAEKGQIVGFLGPNGAGKSTMMKIITCYVSPDQGSVKVCGFDTFENSIDVRRKIGYLPENNPLYLEMYVKEYLDFVCGIYKIKNKKARVAEMIERTGLGIEQQKKIGALSKGYRQRVGLAQAMIHDPEVLILDEPTSGLDPNQLVDIRLLIKELGREKTVMLSTHIMQEVEAMCDKVIIINKGKIVADDKVDSLSQYRVGNAAIVVEFDKTPDTAQLKKLQGVTKLEELGNNKYRISSKGNADVRSELFKYAVDKNLTVLTLNKEEASIEDVFRQLTKGK